MTEAKKSKATLVREATKSNPGATADKIASIVGCKAQYVHSIWYLDRKKPKKGRPGRPRKVVAEVKPTRDNEPTKKVADFDLIIHNLSSEVRELKAVIRYLEGRLYGASV